MFCKDLQYSEHTFRNHGFVLWRYLIGNLCPQLFSQASRGSSSSKLRMLFTRQRYRKSPERHDKEPLPLCTLPPTITNILTCIKKQVKASIKNENSNFILFWNTFESCFPVDFFPVWSCVKIFTLRYYSFQLCMRVGI